MSKAIKVLKDLKFLIGTCQPLIQTDIDKAIAELEAQEAKSCKNCKFYKQEYLPYEVLGIPHECFAIKNTESNDGVKINCFYPPKGFSCNIYEPKDT